MVAHVNQVALGYRFVSVVSRFEVLREGFGVVWRGSGCLLEVVRMQVRALRGAVATSAFCGSDRWMSAA